jgi:SagB-type dehydrogenase family enzyme
VAIPAIKESGFNPISNVFLYHQQTKHHQDRYARSLGYLDWATQPDPFRTFQGAKRIELPLAADGLIVSYADLYTPAAVPARPLDLESVSILFELALGLAAWKEFRGNRWALRCNPSSGNLHPTEGYAILPPLPDFEAGAYHYVSRDHALEQRCFLEEEAGAEFARALPEGSFLVGLSSIHWREAWKYGERAYRYCQHDVGHAIATVRYAAAALGWSALLLDAIADDDVATLLGLDRATDFTGVPPEEREHPDAVILVSRSPVSAPPRGLPVARVRLGHWAGQANKLSSSLSCHQEIAADGAFSLGMIADFAQTIRRQGAWWYRRLFWEAGVLGQVLYLEAEAAGVRSTGIGCYFDDTFHELLGLRGDEFQDLYHFTVGGPIEDRRLLTFPPYVHRMVPDREKE